MSPHSQTSTQTFNDVPCLADKVCPLCYSLSPYSWYLLVVFLSSYSYPFRYVFLWLDSLLDPFKFVQLIVHWTLTLCCSSSVTTGRGDTFLFIPAYYLDSYLRTASPSIRFYCIGYVFSLTHIVLSCSMTFHTYASHSISTLLPVLCSLFLIYAI